MNAPAPLSTPSTAGPSKPASRQAPWTGLLDDAIGRSRQMRWKLLVLSFLYAACVGTAILFLLGRGFSAAFHALPKLGTAAFFGMLLVLLFLFAAVAAGVLDFLLVKPLRTLDRVTPDASLGEMISSFFNRHAALEDRFSKLASEVGVLAGERRQLAMRIADFATLASSSAATVHSLMALTRECVIVTSADECIRELSEPARELLGMDRIHLLGSPFDEVVKLHDLEEGDPLKHPVTGLMKSAIELRSTVPALSQVLLVDHRGGKHSVAAFTAAVVGDDGAPIAGICRLQPLEGRAAPAPDPAGQEAEVDATGFARRAEALVADARQGGAEHVLLLASVDRPDDVSERFGHAAGTSLLWEVGRIIETQAGEGAECFDVSTNHWAVLLRNSGPEAAREVAEKIRLAVDGREFRWHDKRYDVAVSVAVAPITAETGGVTPLLDRADQTLIAAKLAGGNRVQLDTVSPQSVVGRRAGEEWSAWLNEHLKHGRLHLISQEIQPAGKGSGPMLEMLARVEAADGTWEPPGNFLPELARHDLMARLDLQLLKRVVMALEHHPEQATGYRTVFVNLSGASISKPRFAELVMKVLGSSKVPAGLIGFEVDVLEAIDHPAEFAEFVRVVRPSGAVFALDRCKAAMGLNVLNSLPVDLVKIHPSLVERAASDPLDRAYVEWIQRAVKLLGRRTVATGVQNEKTLALMTRIGVDYVQGTHVNKLGPLII